MTSDKTKDYILCHFPTNTILESFSIHNLYQVNTEEKGSLHYVHNIKNHSDMSLNL